MKVRLFFKVTEFDCFFFFLNFISAALRDGLEPYIAFWLTQSPNNQQRFRYMDRENIRKISIQTKMGGGNKLNATEKETRQEIRIITTSSRPIDQLARQSASANKIIRRAESGNMPMLIYIVLM